MTSLTTKTYTKLRRAVRKEMESGRGSLEQKIRDTLFFKGRKHL